MSLLLTKIKTQAPLYFYVYQDFVKRNFLCPGTQLPRIRLAQ